MPSVSISQRRHSDDPVDDDRSQHEQPSQRQVQACCSGSDDQYQSGEDNSFQQQHSGDVDSEENAKCPRSEQEIDLVDKEVERQAEVAFDPCKWPCT